MNINNDADFLKIPKTFKVQCWELYNRAISGKSRKERIKLLLIFIEFLIKKLRREF